MVLPAVIYRWGYRLGVVDECGSVHFGPIVPIVRTRIIMF